MREFNTYKDPVIPSERKSSDSGDGNPNIRKYRPLEANISVVLLDIQAELTMVGNCPLMKKLAHFLLYTGT